MEQIKRKISISMVLLIMIGILFATIQETNAASLEKQTWDYFRKAGCTKQSTAAIMGNIKQESNFKPSLINTGYYGLYNIGKNDYNGLKKYAKKNNTTWKNGMIQNKYMNNVIAPRDFKRYTGKTYKLSNGEYLWWKEKMTWNQFKKQTKIETATKIFNRVITRATRPMYKQRVKYANEYYKKYK